MRYTAVFIGNGKPVARVEGMTPREAHEKCVRLALYGGAFHVQLFLGEENVGRVGVRSAVVEWVACPTAWAHLLDDDELG